MHVENGSFIIRSACLHDATQLTTWWNDGSIMAHAGFPNGSGESITDVENLIQRNSEGKREILMIEKDHKALGEMVYIARSEKVVEIGIKICELAMQNKGYGKLSISMLIDLLFRRYSFEKIILDTNLHNTRAQHVYEQLGFRKIRVNENAWTDQLGQSQSSIDYELMPCDFINYSL